MSSPSSVTINGAPASSTVGTPISVTGAATDPSAVDSTAGLRFRWKVTKDGYLVVQTSTSVTNTSFSFTPGNVGSYTLVLDAYDKDNGNRWTTKVINVAASALNFAAASVAVSQQENVTNASVVVNATKQPMRLAQPSPASIASATISLTADAPTVTVFEGQPAENSGTFVNGNDNPLTLSASLGTLTQEDQIGCMTPPANLVSWWHGDGNANDAIGSNHGTLQNGAGFATGIVGQAFSFDGINDLVNVPSNASIDLRNNLTAMAWFKVTSMAPGANVKVFSKRNAAADYAPFEINLYYNGTDVLANSQASTTGSSWDVNINSSQPLTFGTWYHAAFVMDSNNLHTLYLNGQSQGTQQLAAQLKASVSDPLTIGTSSRGFPFNGLVDEMQVVGWTPLSRTTLNRK